MFNEANDISYSNDFICNLLKTYGTITDILSYLAK